VAAEEPLQLSLDAKPLSIVMRTPGNDLELALGLLWAERVIRSLADVRRVRISAEAGESEPRVTLANDLVESNQVDIYLGSAGGRRPERSFLATSACGVCGATTVESLALDFPALAKGPVVDAAVLPRLADRLREQQRIFESTGGLHAAGLFNVAGELELLREDIGRHNAVDKIVGRALLDGRLPLSRSVLAVSGRAGYEVVQKAVAAGIPVLAAVGAPSSLAVATAERFGMTLVGFLRDDHFNVYTGPERIGR
jgi:FdhD protein